MTDIRALVLALDGMAHKRQLTRSGALDRDLTAAVRTGEVIRVRNGWYSTFDESDPRLRAVRVGGRLTAISLVAALGGWVLGHHPLHVSLPANSARMRMPQNSHRLLDARDPRGVVLHWEVDPVTSRGTATSTELIDALVLVVLDESLEVAVAALDWVLRTGRLDDFQLERIFLRLPQCKQWIRGWVDKECDSLPESLARTRLRLRGHSVRSQVGFGTPERIDLVIDDIVALEIDGEEHHWDRFEKDRGKDIRVTIARYHAIRPSARMIFYEWSLVLAAIETAISLRCSPSPLGIQGAGTAAVGHGPRLREREREREDKAILCS